MSLLIAEGHAEAWSYPIWMVREEARIARARRNAELGTQAVLLQLALLTIPNHALKDSDRKKAAKNFTEQTKRLMGER